MTDTARSIIALVGITTAAAAVTAGALALAGAPLAGVLFAAGVAAIVSALGTFIASH